jgi:hypothetical protein
MAGPPVRTVRFSLRISIRPIRLTIYSVFLNTSSMMLFCGVLTGADDDNATNIIRNFSSGVYHASSESQ